MNRPRQMFAGGGICFVLLGVGWAAVSLLRGGSVGGLPATLAVFGGLLLFSAFAGRVPFFSP